MSVSRPITARARTQVERHIHFWLKDHPDQTSVALEHRGLWVDDFDGNIGQMRKAVREELVRLGWVFRTIKSVQTLIRVQPERTCTYGA